MALKLELALLDTIKTKQFFVDLKQLLQGIYKHYHYSTQATRELKELARALQSKVLAPVNILGTRWAPHMHRALNVLLQHNYSAIFTHFDHSRIKQV